MYNHKLDMIGAQLEDIHKQMRSQEEKIDHIMHTCGQITKATVKELATVLIEQDYYQRGYQVLDAAQSRELRQHLKRLLVHKSGVGLLSAPVLSWIEQKYTDKVHKCKKLLMAKLKQQTRLYYDEINKDPAAPINKKDFVIQLAKDKERRHMIVQESIHTIHEKIFDDPDLSAANQQFAHSAQAVQEWMTILHNSPQVKSGKERWPMFYINNVQAWELKKKWLQAKEDAEVKQDALVESPTMEEKAWLLREATGKRAAALKAIEVASPGQLHTLLMKGKEVTQSNITALKKKKDVAGTRKKGSTTKGSKEHNKWKRADAEGDSEQESQHKPHKKTTTKKKWSHKKIVSKDKYREEEKDNKDESDSEPLAKKSWTQSAMKAAADKPTELEIKDEVAKASDLPLSPSTLAANDKEQDDNKVWVVVFDSKHIPKNCHERGLVHLIKQEEGVWRINDLLTWDLKLAPSLLCMIIAGMTGASNAVWNGNGIKLMFVKRKKLRSEMANLCDVSFFVGFQL